MDHGALDRLSKKLDARPDPAAAGREQVHRTELFESSAPGQTGWTPPPVSARVPRRPRLKPVEMLFVGAVAFFVLAAAVAAFIFFSGGNTVSTKNVAIAINGPTSIRAGDLVSLTIAVTNRNATAMQLTDLVVEFPDGTRSEADVSVDLPRVRIPLGTIAPGASVNKVVRAHIFGQANTAVTVPVSVEYRVESSNAVYHADASYTAPISTSPASIAIENDTQAISGQDTTLAVTVTSNVTDPLSKVLLVAQYPPGFSFTSSTPAPAAPAVWNLGDIQPGGSRTITIHGTFNAEDGEQRVVHFTAGPNSGSNSVTAPLAQADATVTVTKPFISAALALDGDTSGTHIVTRGAVIHGTLHWVNNLTDPVSNVEITVALSGAILDRTKITAPRGFYRSADNTVSFTASTDPALASVAPGVSGDESFTIATLPANQGTFRNPEVDLTVTVKAVRPAEGDVPTTVTSSATAKALVASDLTLASSLSHGGTFAGTGPVPPKADHETTYTVTWALANSANAVANTAVSAVLPSYVRYTNQVTGNGTLMVGAGGAVTWTVGDMAAGDTKTVSFQIGVTPSLSQVGQAPTVISDQRVTGFDRFTGGQVQGTAPSLTTASGVAPQQGNVVN